MQNFKLCPYLERTSTESNRPELLQEYYDQRTIFTINSSDNYIRIGIPEIKLKDSNSKLELIQLSSTIPELLSSASRLQYFRLKLLEKIQCQEELHEKCDNISNEYSIETKQKLMALQETLNKRKSFLQKVVQEKNQQKKIEEEIDELNLSIQDEKNKLVCWKAKHLQSELIDGKIDMEGFNKGLEEVRRNIEGIEKLDEKDKSDFEEKVSEKNRVLVDIEKKINELTKRKSEKLEENKGVLEDLERNKQFRPETEDKFSVNKKSYINYFDEIRELQSQITEYKSLQQSYIADQHSLLEPLKYLETQYIQKSQQFLASDLDSMIKISLISLKSLQDSVKSSSLQLSTSFKSFSNTLQSASSKSESTFKSTQKTLLSTLKTLLLNTQKSELLLKTLDVQDRALDSFKHENCGDI